MKDLQNWKINNNIDFVSYIKRVMAAINYESRYNPNIILEELNEILDQIAAISSFSSVSLKERIKEKYKKRIRIDKSLSKIFRILNNSHIIKKLQSGSHPKKY
jgi:DNA ligase-4